MHRAVQGTARLPRRLLDELSIEENYNGGRRNQNWPSARKEKRRAAKVEKKNKKQFSKMKLSEPDSGLEFHKISRNDASGSRQARSKKYNPDIDPTYNQPQNLRSIKKTHSKIARSRSSSPAAILSRADSRKLLKDDADIAALEKALGLKDNGKLPKSFTEDGLDALLIGLEDTRANDITVYSKRKQIEGGEWLERKRRKAQSIDTKAQTKDETKRPKPYKVSFGEDSSDRDGLVSSDGDDTNSSDSLTEQPVSFDLPNRKPRENPYIAPVDPLPSGESRKYLPPSLRNQVVSTPQDLSLLRRQIQGLLNRISEANIISIVGEVEKLYRNNPRQHVSAIVLGLLMDLICDSSSLQDTFIILHAGFIAAMYKIIGMDFGAQAIQKIYEEFVALYPSNEEAADTNRASANLVSLLTELYNFQVIDSTLIYDFIRLFLEDFTEHSIELVLKIMRSSSSQLRQDGASSLKDIFHLLQCITARMREDKLSVRTRFMIETISNLKDNRVRSTAITSTVASEHRVRMKKTLGSLNMRSIRALEPLRIGVKDIQDADKRGKWWLIGASYKDADRDHVEPNNFKQNGQTVTGPEEPELFHGNFPDLVHLAREQRMNTDIRRSIFVAVMSAVDYEDAHSRLQKLHLRKTQELEIPKVLIHCAAAEQTYNPFYSLLSRRFCSDRKLKMAFQFSLWSLFKQMGEDRDNPEEELNVEDCDTLGLRKIVNLAKMFGFLIAENGLGIGVLKTLDFGLLQPKTKTFVELLLITTILHSQLGSENKRDEKSLMKIFLKSQDTPILARGLQYFLKKVVCRTDIAGSAQDCKTVRWGCKVACDALRSIVASSSLPENEVGS